MANHFSLIQVQENKGSRFVLLTEGGSTFSISPELYRILHLKQQGMSNQAIADELNKIQGTSIYTSTIIESTVMDTVTRTAQQGREKRSYILLKRTILPAGKCSRLYKLLAQLFGRYTCWVLILLALSATGYFAIREGSGLASGIFQIGLSNLNITQAILLFACTLPLTCLHELGHAAAAYRFGIAPKAIGIGLYLFMPVLYTDVTGAWSLPKQQRLAVNLGGIYFQLLANLLLVPMFYLGQHPSMVGLLIVTNTTSIIVSINPFLKYDGYWVFSDAFDLPNLEQKSRAISRRFATMQPLLDRYPIVLKTYAICKAIFWLSICCYSINIVITSINRKNGWECVLACAVPLLVMILAPYQLLSANPKTTHDEA